jgi:predicted house-cleaning noncanonical NTP pyrophosphatase (MazG superfamily)
MKTSTFRLNKLVRDKIVESTKRQGGTVNYKSLKGKELTKALVEKLVEEAKELQGLELSASELADIKEIIEQIAKNLEITEEDLVTAQTKKRSRNGSFTKGHFIETLTLPADPQRFPEVKTQ